MSLTVYLIRHGQTNVNKAKALQGRSDSPLNDIGREQAKKAHAYFREEKIHFGKVYSSPLSRAVETGKIVSGGECRIRQDDRLLEMDYGPYEGCSLEQPPAEVIHFFRDFVHHAAPEGMEPLSDVVARMGAFLEELRVKEEGTVLISTHAIALKGALEYLTPKSEGSYWSKYIGNCEVYRTEAENGTFSVPVSVFQI